MRTKILYECQKSGLHVTLGWGEMSVLSGLTTFSWSLACMRMMERISVHVLYNYLYGVIPVRIPQ